MKPHHNTTLKQPHSTTNFAALIVLIAEVCYSVIDWIKYDKECDL